ncbi:MAG: hypothetical protein OQK98_08720 [Gammaproteobacteria bacterium]|nr:hypothetical protein [Gammaproteobacteria bacterium]
MKALLIIATSLIVSSCQTLHTNDPTSIAFDIPDGSTLSLNKNLFIGEGNTHTIIQWGKITTDKEKDLYNISCSLKMKAFGPRTVQPDTFKIRRTEDGQEQASGPNIINYFTEIYLHSDHNSDIIKLVCSAWADKLDGNFPVSAMQKTLGDYFTFNFAEPRQ